MKTYDFLKAKRIIKENKNILQSASLGMHEDWYWTAETIWEDGKYVPNFPKNNKSLLKHTIGGIDGSLWATPTLELIFKDGTEKMIPCYNNGESEEKPEWFSLGVLSQPIQDNITPLSEE